LIKFNVPPVTGKEIEYIHDVISNKHLSGDGKYTKLCNDWIEHNIGTRKALLTTSCTHALEMAALLIDVQPEDEIIMPSYTFVSTANAFVLRGAKIIFVDIRPDTMNIDENKIELAITAKTKAIVAVHYAGVACEMDKIMELAEKYNLYVIEDAAQAMMSSYKGKKLGTIGHLGTFSFHETKNFVSGEGGALLVNDERLIERAEIIREKGTNRSQFIRGQVDKYTWQDIGSSYLPSEIVAAYLYAQLENIEQLFKRRMNLWNRYYIAFEQLTNKIELPKVPENVEHNGHIFYLKCENREIRNDLIDYLKDNKIQSTFHYVPLHTSPYGKKVSVFYGEDEYTTFESNRLIRLPLHFNMSDEDIDYIINKIMNFWRGK